MVKADIIKVTQHCLCTGLAHCPVMVRALPLLILLGMAGLTGAAANIGVLCLTDIAGQGANKKDYSEGCFYQGYLV